MIQQIESISELRSVVGAARGAGSKIGFVPTMGYLHEGHLSLVRQAKERADFVVVSIFVNPAQFNDPKDFAAYPIDLARDSKLLESAHADVLFVPTPELMYGTRFGSAQASEQTGPAGFQSWVTVEKLSQPLEGAHRPGHFRGVSTVVSILFNIVQADFSVFGEKDFQQLRLIEQMVKDLKVPTEIVRGALVRESDGLAMSSRNVRLSAEARRAALSLSRGLKRAGEACKFGERRSAKLCEIVSAELSEESLVQVEYVEIAAESTLQPLAEISEPARLLVAAVVGGVRLIDNVALI